MDNRTILVIDDQPGVHKLMQEVFKNRFVCLGASNGKEALQIMSESRPVIAILDIRLSGEDGLELLEKIKTLCPETSVIMLSGLIGDESIDKAREIGATRYITKPFDVLKLKEEVESLYNYMG